jgi:hypothetical protein
MRFTKSRKKKYARHVTSTGEKGNACRGLAEKVEGRRPLGIFRRRKEDNIKTDLKEIRQRVWTGFI